MMEHLLTISLRFRQVADFMGRSSAWLMVGLIVVIVFDVTLRNWFVIGSTKLQELEWHLHGALFLLALGWAYNHNAHVRIELLSEHWRPRKKAAVEFIGCCLFLLPYITAVIWFGLDYVAYSIEYNEASPSATGLPDRWLIKAAIPIGFAGLGCAAISKLLQAFVFLFGSESDQEKTEFSIIRHPHDQTPAGTT